MIRLLTKVIRNCDKEELTYVSGKLNFILTLDEAYDVSDGYTFTLYNDYLCQLLHAESGDGQTKHKEGVCNVRFNKSIILLPGHYFLLFRCGFFVLRFDLEMQEKGVLKETGIKKCQPLSMEDVLENRISGKFAWKHLSMRPGLRQWKLWMTNRMQQRELNVFRSENQQWMFDYCNNMLITSETTDGIWRDLRLLCFLTEIKNVKSCTDCTTLCKAPENPYKEVDNIFRAEENIDNIFGIPLPDTKERQYIFYNIGKILETGKEEMLERILHYAPGEHISVIFCGTEKDITRLLEMRPELKNMIPEYNRFATEKAGVEELILTFFSELEQVKTDVTPEATDAICKWFYRKYKEGEICNWTFLDVRQFIKNRLFPKYVCRAIASIQAGCMPDDALYIMPEDVESI